MVHDPNLFWFGCVLWLVSVLVIFNLVNSQPETDYRANQNQAYPVKYANVSDTDQDREVEELRQECWRLRQKLQMQSKQLQADFRNATFSQLQTLLINYPSVRKLAQEKPDLPAKNLVPLFTPLDNLLASWGYQPIGSPWEQVPFNPQVYQPDADNIGEGELVYVRFVGYRNGDRILSPAKVSRNLPIKG